MASRAREVIVPLYSLFMRLNVWSGAHSTRTWSCWNGSRGGPQRGLGHLSYGVRLREMGLFSLEKRRLWGDFIVAFQYLKLINKMEIRKFFTQTEHWNWLPREAVNDPSLVMYKARLDRALGRLI